MPILSTLELSPEAVDLYTLPPGNTVQLDVVARDTAGSVIPTEGKLTYLTSPPAVASVSSSGLLTAGEPGTATVLVILNIGRVWRQASMSITVFPHGPYPDIAGVYDLDALVTEDGWGTVGTRQRAVVTIEQQDHDTPRFAGSFEDLATIAPDGEPVGETPLSGSVTGYVDLTGDVHIGLCIDTWGCWWSGAGNVTPDGIAGTFWFGDGPRGSFAAVRRPLLDIRSGHLRPVPPRAAVRVP